MKKIGKILLDICVPLSQMSKIVSFAMVSSLVVFLFLINYFENSCLKFMTGHDFSSFFVGYSLFSMSFVMSSYLTLIMLTIKIKKDVNFKNDLISDYPEYKHVIEVICNKDFKISSPIGYNPKFLCSDGAGEMAIFDNPEIKTLKKDII